ncbi:MAG: hypothetical protein P4L85_12535, partial [Paludisphaera borealis]|nr:hypothetical protein [Paludisphaera borealis]
MRQFFFAIVLVAAAVVGGAIVNGPGFRWAQDHVFDYMGLKDGGEIALVDLPPAPGDANADPAPSQPPTGSSNRKGGPAAADRASRKPDPKQKSLPQVFGGEKPAPTPEPKSPEPVASAAPPTPTPSPTPDSIPIPPALAGPAGAPGPEPSAPPAPL